MNRAIDLRDCRVDTFQAAVRGAVITMRITHIPTNISVEGDGRSAYRLRGKLLAELNNRVIEEAKHE